MKRASIGRAVSTSFWNAYDHLGRLILLNLLWSLIGLPWMLASGVALFLAWSVFQAGNRLLAMCLVLGGSQTLFVSPPTAGLFALCRDGMVRRDAGVQEMLSIFRRYLVKSQILGLMGVAGTAILYVNLLFYLRIGGLLGLTLGGMMGWGLLFWMLIFLFAIPVLVSQERGVVAVLKGSALIVLAHPLFSLFLLCCTGMLFIVGLLTGVGLILGSISLTAVFLNTALRELIRGSMSVEQSADMEEREQEKRGWRDLLKPWEM